VRDLRELLAGHARVADLTPEEAAATLTELAALQAALAARLRPIPTPPSLNGREHVGDRLLTPPEAAKVLGVTVQWLYRHSRRLDFAVRLSRRVLRFSHAGLQRYLAERGA